MQLKGRSIATPLHSELIKAYGFLAISTARIGAG